METISPKLFPHKFYLSGPMTGIEDYNFPAFAEAARRLRRSGYDIVSPHEVDHGDTEAGSLPHSEYLRGDLLVMLKERCTDIILLPGWEGSKGVDLEFYVARALGMGVWFYALGELKCAAMRRVSKDGTPG